LTLSLISELHRKIPKKAWYKKEYRENLCGLLPRKEKSPLHLKYVSQQLYLSAKVGSKATVILFSGLLWQYWLVKTSEKVVGQGT